MEEAEAALDPGRPIIDAHHHLWDAASTHRFRPYPIEIYAAERAQSGHNIRASVFVDCAYGYLTDGPKALRPTGETRTVEAKARQADASGQPGIAAGIVSTANMLLGADVEPVLLAHMAESPGRFRGVRQVTPWHPGVSFYGGEGAAELLRTPQFAGGVSVLSRLALTFDAYVYATQLYDVAYLARQVPGATIILNHVGAPRSVPLPADEADAIWRRGLIEVASCPNVVLKVGGLLMHRESAEAYSSDAAAVVMRDHILGAIDIFGPHRCMFESNFPVDGRSISYGVLWNAFKKVVIDFSDAEKDCLFYRTAARTYRLLE